MNLRKNLLIALLALFFCAVCPAATYYVAAGVASTNVGAATSSSAPCNLNAAWDDMCAGTTIGTGDTIQLADGTYNDTTNDVPVAGLGDCAQNIDLTIQSKSGDPALCIIDFSGNNANVDGFHITTTGTWTIKGLTIHGSDATTGEGEITFIDGTLHVLNCIIYNDRIRGTYGVIVISTSAAAHGILYNSEIYDTADDGYTNAGTGGAAADRIIEAHYCYFHDIDTASNTQGMTNHNDSTAKAYFCRFKNIGLGHGTGSGNGAAIGSGSGSCPIYVDNCTIEDCFLGVGGTGAATVRNCTFMNIDTEAIVKSGDTADAIIDSCLIWDAAITTAVINVYSDSDITIKRCAIKSDTTFTGISTLDSGYNGAKSRIGKSLTVEDCVIYTPAAQSIVTKHQTLNCRRNLLWGKEETAGMLGLVHNYFDACDVNNVVMNIEHNCMNNTASGQPIIGTWGDTTSGAVTANVTSYIIGNTYSTGATLFKTENGTIAAGDLDQAATITWRGFTKEMMLSPNSVHYRDFGAAMMPGWYRPKGNQNMGTFCRRPIVPRESIYVD